MMKRKIFISLLASTSLLLMSGCSSSNSDSGASAAGQIPEVAVDAAAAALVPDRFKDQGISIASDIPYAPMEMFDENNNVYGVDYDLAVAIGQKLGLKISFNDQDWDGIIPSLQSGLHDVIISGMNDTVERQATLDFVDYFKGGFAIVVKKGNPEGITTLTDLCGKTVAVIVSTVQGDLLRALEPQCIEAGKAPVDVMELPDDPAALSAIRAGKAVADVSDAPVAAYAAQTAGDGQYFELVKDAANPNGYDTVYTGIAVLKEDNDLALAIQAALQSLMDDGTYMQILKKYNVDSFAVPEATINGTKS
jgi:polar amino acid transport system substrate-binding protein